MMTDEERRACVESFRDSMEGVRGFMEACVPPTSLKYFWPCAQRFYPDQFTEISELKTVLNTFENLTYQEALQKIRRFTWVSKELVRRVAIKLVIRERNGDPKA